MRRFHRVFTTSAAFVGFALVSSAQPDTAPAPDESTYAGVDCAKLEGWVRADDTLIDKKKYCAETRARLEGDPSWCRYAVSVNQCVLAVAIASGNPRDCEAFPGRSGVHPVEQWIPESKRAFAWLYDCYRAMAYSRSEPDLCDLIPFDGPEGLEICRDSSMRTASPTTEVP